MLAHMLLDLRKFLSVHISDVRFKLLPCGCLVAVFCSYLFNRKAKNITRYTQRINTEQKVLICCDTVIPNVSFKSDPRFLAVR